MSLSRRSALKLLGLGAAAGLMTVQARDEGMLHYIHPDHIVGDVHPFYHEGTWYLYYLAPGFHSRLMTSTDLIHWTQIPITHEPPNDESPELAPYFVLGVFRDTLNGVFRTYHGWTAGNMHSHVSDNLIDWRFAPNSYRVLAQYTRYSSQRDPYVFWNEAEQQYWCVMTCKVEGYDDATSGAVGFASSPDLQRWQGRGDLYFPGTIREPEVPQVFNIGSKWYLLASIYTGIEVGKPSYWVSDAPTGPWEAPLTDSLDGQHLQAANVGFDGERWLLFGWIPLTTPQTHGRYTWGGHLAFPREVYQLPNGELGTRLEAAFGRAVRGELLYDSAAQPITPESGSWTLDNGFASTGDGRASLGTGYDRFYAEIDFTPTAGSRVALRIGERYEAGVDVAQGRLFIGSISSAPLTYADLSAAFTAAPTHMRVLVEGDIVEMFVNDRYSLAARLPRKVNVGALHLITAGGEVRRGAARAYGLLA